MVKTYFSHEEMWMCKKGQKNKIMIFGLFEKSLLMSNLISGQNSSENKARSQCHKIHLFIIILN